MRHVLLFRNPNSQIETIRNPKSKIRIIRRLTGMARLIFPDGFDAAIDDC